MLLVVLKHRAFLQVFRKKDQSPKVHSEEFRLGDRVVSDSLVPYPFVIESVLLLVVFLAVLQLVVPVQNCKSLAFKFNRDAYA